MAVYHFKKSYFSRRKGNSACERAAYRCGEKITDYYYGEVYDYRRKSGVVYSKVFLPEGVPEELKNRSILWSAVEMREHRKDARLSTELELALPVELSLEEQITLLTEFVSDNFISLELIADVNIHNKSDGNPHAHIMLTTRPINRGEFGNKNRDIDKKAVLESWRHKWAKIQNREFQKKGLICRVTHERKVTRGIEKETARSNEYGHKKSRGFER